MLSQCNTIFTMRLSHQRDQELVRAALSDAAIGLLEALPTLGNAEAAGRHYRQALDLALAQLRAATGGRRRPAF